MCIRDSAWSLGRSVPAEFGTASDCIAIVPSPRGTLRTPAVIDDAPPPDDDRHDALTAVCDPRRRYAKDALAPLTPHSVGPFGRRGTLETQSTGNAAVRNAMNARLRALAVLLTVVAIVPADAPARTTSSSPTLGPARDGTVVKELRFGQSRLLVSFAPGEFRLSEQDFLDWVLRSARAMSST